MDASPRSDHGGDTDLLGTNRVSISVNTLTSIGICIQWLQNRFLGGSVLGRPHGCRAGSPSETAQTHRKALFQWLLWLRETGYDHLRMKHRADTAVRMGLALPTSTRTDSRVSRPRPAHPLLPPTSDDNTTWLKGYTRATEKRDSDWALAHT